MSPVLALKKTVGDFAVDLVYGFCASLRRPKKATGGPHIEELQSPFNAP